MFSKQTIAFLYYRMPRTHADMKIYLIKYDLNQRIVFRSTDNSLPKKSAAIVEYLVNNPDERDNFGNLIVFSLLENLVGDLCSRNDFDENIQDFRSLPEFYHHLRLDGYDIDFDSRKLIATLPVDISAFKKEDSILKVLDDYSFSITKTHYQQAKANYLSNNAALTGQLRTFTESLFSDMALYIKGIETDNQDIANIRVTNASTALQVLAKCSNPILNLSLNEWDGQGKGYIESFWRRLHPQGSHPGIPNVDEAVYRYQLVLLNINLLTQRFKQLY